MTVRDRSSPGVTSPLRSMREEIRLLKASDAMCAGTDDALRTVGLVAFAGAISRVPELRDRLCLKGGTLLRLLSNGPIGRPPSKDLDGTLLSPAGFDPRMIETEVVDAANAILRSTYRERVLLTARRLEPDRPLAGGAGIHVYMYQLTMEAYGLFDNPNKVTRAADNAFKFDLCDDELVIDHLLVPLKITQHGIAIDLRVYAPIQSLAEKLRALLQKHQHYDNAISKGRDPNAAAGSFVPRHVLDLEYIIPLLAPDDLNQLPDIFTRKCEARSIPSSERTFERMTNAVLRDKVRDECARLDRDFTRCWTLLTDLARRVTQ